MNCEFFEPVNLGGEAKPDWEFSKFICEPEIFELIVNQDREFFIQKTLTYGEAIIIWFLTLFIIVLTAKMIFNFFWKK